MPFWSEVSLQERKEPLSGSTLRVQAPNGDLTTLTSFAVEWGQAVQLTDSMESQPLGAGGKGVREPGRRPAEAEASGSCG